MNVVEFPGNTISALNNRTVEDSLTLTRRPIQCRKANWAVWLAGWIAQRGVSPNEISQVGLGSAIYSAAAFYFAADSEGMLRTTLFSFAVLFCLARLLCNLMDGMVAIEGGKAGENGEFWNEVPDRLSDIMILVGIGYGIGSPELGWAAAAFAVLAAYVRQLGGSTDFCGPMAKAHRMAAVSAAGFVCLFLDTPEIGNTVLFATLWVVFVGTLLTVLRRCKRLLKGDQIATAANANPALTSPGVGLASQHVIQIPNN